MRNIHDSGEYNKYKNTSGEHGGSGCGGWIVIVVVVAMLISFIADGASWNAIDTLLGLGLILYWFIKWMSR